MYNAIQDLQDLAIAANNVLSDKQLVNIGIQLIKTMNDFEKGLIDWYACPSAEHTFVNFKSHFEAAYLSLRKVRGIIMKNTIFQQQANSVSENILTEIKRDNESVRQEIRATESKLFSVFENLSEENKEENEENIPPTSNTVNAMTSDNNLQLKMLQLLNDMQKEMKSLKTEQTQTRLKKRKNQNDNGKPKQRWRANTSCYCWSCGAGNHVSKNCKKKKEGHKDEASFKNRMNGCTDFCQGISE